MERNLSQLSEASFRSRTIVLAYLAMISILGSLGNTLIIIVYSLKFMPTPTRVFVLFMALLDLLTSVVAIPLQIYNIRHAYNANMYMCRSLLAVSSLSSQASNLVLVLMVLDRYRRIRTPFRKQLLSRQAMQFSTASVGLAVVIFAPFIPHYGTHHIQTTAPAVQVRMCWWYDEYKDTVYPTLYTMTVIITFLVCLAAMVVCYISMWSRPVKRRSMSDGSTARSVTSSGIPTRVVSTLTVGVQGRCSVNPENVAAPVDKPNVIQSSHSPETSRTPRASTTLSRSSDLTESSPGLSITQIRNHSALVILILILFYFISWLPHAVARVTFTQPVDLCDNLTDCEHNTSYAIFLRSYYFNSAVKVFVYTLCNARFRMKCRELYRDICGKIGARK